MEDLDQDNNKEIKVEEKDNKISCNKCGSKFIYVRIKGKEVVCRSCGNIQQLN